MTRRAAFKSLVAAGTLPLFNVGCAGFGESRARKLAKGAKTRIAIIGCGDWGRALLSRAGLVGGCELVALCEPDPAAIGVLYANCAKVWGRDALVRAAVFADYREMFSKLGDGLDAVFIATPNHHHALPALMAVRRGIAAYVEKPMAHTLEEVLLIEREAKKTGAIVRVGNKGHNISHRPLLAKYLKDGVIGDVTDVFSFSDRPNTMLHRPH